MDIGEKKASESEAVEETSTNVDLFRTGEEDQS